MNIYWPLFIPVYLLLVVFLIYWASSLALHEIDDSGTTAAPKESKISWAGVFVVALGFLGVRLVEYTKQFQYKGYTRAEVAKHTSLADGVWLIVDKDVYDVTDFVRKHPAGASIILRNSGKDATRHFNYHLEATKHFWRRAKIGWVLDEEA